MLFDEANRYKHFANIEKSMAATINPNITVLIRELCILR